MPKEGAKNFVCGRDFGASPFLTLGPRGFFSLGFRFWGPWTLLGPALFGSRAKTGNKKMFGAPQFGASIFKFWGL